MTLFLHLLLVNIVGCLIGSFSGSREVMYTAWIIGGTMALVSALTHHSSSRRDS